MTMKVISWLEAAGAQVKKVAQEALSKILPVAAEVAQEAEPLVDLLLPAFGKEFNTVVAAVISTEQAYAASGQQNGTGSQKLQAVLAAVRDQLAPKLATAGITEDAATAAISKYVNAIVEILNGPAIARAVNTAAK